LILLERLLPEEKSAPKSIEYYLLTMAEAPPPVSQKRKRGRLNEKTGMIGVTKKGQRYQTSINYGGRKYHLGLFDTKEQACIAYDRAAIDQSTEEVSFTLNYPNMTEPEREEALKVEPVQKTRGKPNQTTGLIGVYKNGKKYKAEISYGGASKNLGVFATKEQAGMAYDRFVVDKSTEAVFFTLNYPNMSGPEREEALQVEPAVQKKRGKPNPTTGLIGVHKSKNKYNASIKYGGTSKYLGTFDTKEQAGVAYDLFVVDKSTEEVSFALNYPNMTDSEREEALPVVQKKRGIPNPTTGLIGVAKSGKKYKASVMIGGTQHNLGSFDTKEQAGVAYDRFIVDKSTEKVSFVLNYPNMTGPEREDALKVEPPKKKRKRGTKRRGKESDDGSRSSSSSSSSSSSASCHSSDDDESDDEEAFPQVPPYM
jgi:serine protease inhibitor ecotin